MLRLQKHALRFVAKDLVMRGDSIIRSMLAICTTILVCGALYLGRSIFAPAAFSIFVVAIVWPFQRVLQTRIPKLAAVVFTLLLTLLALTLLGLAIAWGSSQVGHWLLGNLERFQFIYLKANEWLEQHGIFVAGMLADRFDVSWLVRLAQGVAGSLNSMAGFALLVFAFTILGLMEVNQVDARIRKLESRHSGLKLAQAFHRMAEQFRKYIVIRSVASMLTGFVTFCFALLVGLELALAWGVISFVLNYIPFLGPLVAVVLTAVFAAAQFETWQMAAIVLAGLSVIQFSIGSYLEPMLAGATLAISPFVVLFAVFFWSFLWNIPGAFIGVPLTIALLTICEQYESSRWLPMLLSDSSGQKPATGKNSQSEEL
jgi:AI-2 transport protein TqsA